MKIDSVDCFYLSLPEVRDIGDGSQDALLVRVEANGDGCWGECEAAPLVSLASWNCPMSHSACKPVSASVLGHLALSASLQAYAGIESDDLCEYPFEPSALAREFTAKQILPDAQGQVRVPEQPGLGLEPDWPALKKYLVEVEIKVAGRQIFSSRGAPV